MKWGVRGGAVGAWMLVPFWWMSGTDIHTETWVLLIAFAVAALATVNIRHGGRAHEPQQTD